MKSRSPTRPQILERRRLKRGAREAKLAREQERDRERRWQDVAKNHVLVNPENLRRYNSYGTPEFMRRGYYVDLPFNCKSCGVAQVWTETQQKWWYEVAKGFVYSSAVRCRACRQKQRERRDAARLIHLRGLAKKKQRLAKRGETSS